MSAAAAAAGSTTTEPPPPPHPLLEETYNCKDEDWPRKADVLYLYGGTGTGKSYYAEEMLKEKAVRAKYAYDGGDCTALVHTAMGALRGGWNIVIESNVKPPEKLRQFCTIVFHCEPAEKGFAVWTTEKGPGVGTRSMIPISENV